MNAPTATPEAPKARRGRPPGRTRRQEEMRRETRTAIIEAAGQVFTETPYPLATIDDIIRAAKISRATFYDHFETKLALAVTLYDSIAQDWLQHFDLLKSPDVLAPGKLEQWIRALADLYVAHGFVTPLVEQLIVTEPSFRQRLDSDRDALIEWLGRCGVPGFMDCAEVSATSSLKRARARLLLLRLDQVSGMIARSEQLSTDDCAAYIAVLAEEWRRHADADTIA